MRVLYTVQAMLERRIRIPNTAIDLTIKVYEADGAWTVEWRDEEMDARDVERYLRLGRLLGARMSDEIKSVWIRHRESHTAESAMRNFQTGGCAYGISQAAAKEIAEVAERHYREVLPHLTPEVRVGFGLLSTSPPN